MTKAFTNLLVMQAIEQGRFALTTPISELIPEFKGHGREKILMWHLLSHQAGFPIIFEVRPGWTIDNFDEVSAITIEDVKPVDAPCAKVSYSPLVNHVLMAAALLRTDPKKRRYRQMVQEDILDPLGMILLTIPVFVPMFAALNLDLVWFGVLVVKYIGIGLLTPPVGFNIYVVAGALNNKIPLQTIFRGCYWFLLCEAVIMTLLIAFPQISLWLPDRMN